MLVLDVLVVMSRVGVGVGLPVVLVLVAVRLGMLVLGHWANVPPADVWEPARSVKPNQWPFCLREPPASWAWRYRLAGSNVGTGTSTPSCARRTMGRQRSACAPASSPPSARAAPSTSA